jgi:hypothetical protein
MAETSAAAAAWARRHLEAIALLAAYGALCAAWNAAGGSFRVYTDLWQLLPWPPLLHDLGGSLLDLHAQPPLLNLLLGLALKASVGLGASVESLLQPLYFAIGAAALLATRAVAERLVPRAVVRWAVLALLVANPYLYAALHYLFYTAWELLFLSLGAWLSLRWLDRPSPARLAAALAPAALLVYTRSLFHPAWFALHLALLLALGRKGAAGRWRALAAVSAASLALVAAWPLKNLVRFGFFGLSSWSGISIARGLPTGEPLVLGYPARLAAFARLASDPLDPAAAAAAQRLVPARFLGHPTLAALAKPDGAPNWNHYALIPLSREIGAAAMEQLRREPRLLALKAVDFYLNGYAVYEARWPYERGFSPEMTVGYAWASAYEAVVFQRFRAYDPATTQVTTGFAVLFPLVLGAAAVALWRRRRARGTQERAVVAMLFTILWVLALVVLVDGPEGNRVRFSTEPYVFLVVGWLLGGRGAGADGPPSA